MLELHHIATDFVREGSMGARCRNLWCIKRWDFWFTSSPSVHCKWFPIYLIFLLQQTLMKKWVKYKMYHWSRSSFFLRPFCFTFQLPDKLPGWRRRLRLRKSLQLRRNIIT